MRRPAHLERAGALTPRDRVWSAIRALGEFSVADIMVLSEQRDDTALTYLRGLEKAGIVKPADSSAYAARRREFRRFRLVRDVGAHAPRVDGDGKEVTQGIGRQQLWNAMRRVGGSFGWRDLMLSCTAGHRPAESEAKAYVRLLARAGYLGIDRPWTSHREGRYQFIRARDTGPRAPIVTRAKQVMDANTGDIVYDPNLELQGGEYDR